VIEAIPEVLELKHRLYAALTQLLADDAILASNISGLPPDQLATPLQAKDRFVIAHFWNPPHMIPLVEVGASEGSSQARDLVGVDMRKGWGLKVQRHEKPLQPWHAQRPTLLCGINAVSSHPPGPEAPCPTTSTTPPPATASRTIRSKPSSPRV
jgi:3-hydroxyacyl-CoA dehydrogenase, NAD binding domain